MTIDPTMLAFPPQPSGSGPSPPVPQLVLAIVAGERRQLIQTALESHYTIKYLSNDEDVLAAVQGLAPALLLAELALPGRSDGVELLRTLRPDSTSRAIPVLLLVADEQGYEQGLEAGADDCLGYPFSPRSLLNCVARLAELARLRRFAEQTQQQQASEQRFHRILDTMLEGCQIIGFDWRYLYLNDSVVRHSRRRRTDLLGRTLMEVYPGIEQTEVFAAMQHCMEARTPYQMQNKFDYGDGFSAWFDLSIQPAPEGIFVLSIDITERKRTEQALDTSEQQYRLLADRIADVVWVLDPQHMKFTYVSPSAQRLLGFTVEEMLDQSLEHVITPASFTRLKVDLPKRVQQFLAGDQSAVTRLDEVEQRHKDGSTVWTEVATTLVLNEQADLEVIGVSRDISQRKRLETHMLLAQKMESVGQLAGGIAHDFNNLLTVIGGYADLAMSTFPINSPIQDDLREIAKATAQAATLTRQLLAFARRQVIEPRVVNMNELIKAMEKLLRRLLGEAVDLVTLLAPDLGQVKADPGQIEQVLINLTINARDAMPRGGKFTIETRNVELDESYARQRVDVIPGMYVLVAVSDSGVGMDDATRQRIFEPFFTTKAPGHGTGLGLATCFGIVKQHGGNIWVYSEPNQGTTFTIYLPQVSAEAEQLLPLVAPHYSLHGSETVLLAEDDPAVRALALRILQEQGYRVLEAADGESALQLTQTLPDGAIQLLITDLVMPQMSGKRLFEQLGACRPDLKAIFISGYADDAIIHHGRLDPGMVFLHKPFSPGALARKVRDVLDGRV